MNKQLASATRLTRLGKKEPTLSAARLGNEGKHGYNAPGGV
ncbi:MAG: hypothetical protein WBX25_11090 [Rhodomicrobium sp.]